MPTRCSSVSIEIYGYACKDLASQPASQVLSLAKTWISVWKPSSIRIMYAALQLKITILLCSRKESNVSTCQSVHFGLRFALIVLLKNVLVCPMWCRGKAQKISLCADFPLQKTRCGPGP